MGVGMRRRDGKFGILAESFAGRAKWVRFFGVVAGRLSKLSRAFAPAPIFLT
jgi:hypothetical protein